MGRVYEVHRRSIHPAMRVCKEWESLLLNEDVKVVSEDQRVTDWLGTFFSSTNFMPAAQSTVVCAFGLGRWRSSGAASARRRRSRPPRARPAGPGQGRPCTPRRPCGGTLSGPARSAAASRRASASPSVRRMGSCRSRGPPTRSGSATTGGSSRATRSEEASAMSASCADLPGRKPNVIKLGQISVSTPGRGQRKGPPKAAGTKEPA